LEYSTDPGPGGTFLLKRTLGDRVTRWTGTPCKEVHFALKRAAGRTFVVAEILLVDEDTAARPDLSNRRPFALRVVKRLRDPANFKGIKGNPFPEHILGPLPIDAGTAPTLTVGADPDDTPVTESGVGLEVKL
jgi:hypothetical protein